MARITNDVTRRSIRQVDIGHVRAMQGYPDKPGGACERAALHHSVKTIVQAHRLH